jgi:hypothetical protein
MPGMPPLRRHGRSGWRHSPSPVTIDFATLRRVEDLAIHGPELEKRALLLGNETDGWKVLDLSEEIGPDQSVSIMRLVSDQLILITHPSRSLDSVGAPRVSVRVATVR